MTVLSHFHKAKGILLLELAQNKWWITGSITKEEEKKKDQESSKGASKNVNLLNWWQV